MTLCSGDALKVAGGFRGLLTALPKCPATESVGGKLHAASTQS